MTQNVGYTILRMSGGKEITNYLILGEYVPLSLIRPIEQCVNDACLCAESYIIVLFYDFYQLILGLNCYLISSGTKRKALCWILCWREMVLCVAYWRRSVDYFLPYVVIYFPFLFQFVDAEVVCMLLIITTPLYFVWIVLYCLFSLGKLASKGISERKHCKVP